MLEEVIITLTTRVALSRRRKESDICEMEECINCGFKKIWSDLMVSIHCSYLNGMYVPMCVNAGVNHWGGITTAHLSSVEWCWIFHGIFEDQCSLMSRWSGVYTHVGGRQRVTCPYYG
ncbi:uncharacterized protein [Dysidea avara]|uniref:uncharacterized protein isoform X3 n=1 Tax=Dysidea avara TaxID=196820 RepID=UPI0033315D6E